MSLLANLLEAPPRLSAASKFTSYCGVMYMGSGIMLLAWPAALQTLFFDPPFAGREEGLVRVLGMILAIAGWFYIFGGRSGGKQFVAATVLDRIVLVPLVLIPTATAGIFPHTMMTFAILDPVLALVAWYLLAKSQV